MIFRIFITNSTAGKVAFCLHLWNIVILSIIVVVSAGVGYKCHTSTQCDTWPLYLCGFLENSFSGHTLQ